MNQVLDKTREQNCIEIHMEPLFVAHLDVPSCWSMSFNFLLERENKKRRKKRKFPFIAYWVQGTMLRSFHVLSHLILRTAYDMGIVLFSQIKELVHRRVKYLVQGQKGRK